MSQPANDAVLAQMQAFAQQMLAQARASSMALEGLAESARRTATVQEESAKRHSKAGGLFAAALLSKVPVIGRFAERMAHLSLISGGGGVGLGKAGILGIVELLSTGIGTAVKLAKTAAVAATPGGMDTLNKSLMIFFATVGGPLVTIIPTLAAGVLTTASVMSELLSGATGVGNYIRDSLIPAFIDLLANIREYESVGKARALKNQQTDNRTLITLNKELKSAAGFGKKATENLFDGRSKLSTMFEIVESMAGENIKHGEKKAWDLAEQSVAAIAERDKNLKGTKERLNKDFGKNFTDVMNSAISSLMKQSGTQMGFQEIANVWKEVQMQAVRDPLEAKLLEVLLKNLQTLQALQGWLQSGGKTGNETMQNVWGQVHIGSIR